MAEQQSIEDMVNEERELHERSKLEELEDDARERLRELREMLDHAHDVLKERERRDEGALDVDEARRRSGATPPYVQ